MIDKLQQDAVWKSMDVATKRLIEASSVLLLAGFVASLIVNGYVFSSWSISYLGVASTSDVLMDGMYFLFDLGYAFIIFTLAAVGPSLVGVGRPLRSLVRTFPFSAMAMAVIVVALIESRPYLWRTPMSAPDSAWFVQLYSTTFAVGLVGSACSAYCLVRPSEEDTRWVRPWMYKAIFGLLAGATLIGISGVINYRRDIGYFDSFLVLPEDSDPCENNSAQVVWIGGDFSAARCSPNAEVRLFRTDTIDYLKPIGGREIRCDERWLLVLRRCRYAPTGKL